MTTDKIISTNRKAYHDYEVLETYEAGIAYIAMPAPRGSSSYDTTCR